jgi:glycerophosphoryl diester phosphodiesterase
MTPCSKNRPLIIGHRGARGHEAENTLASIRRALEMGVDMVEFDVRAAKTGEPVVIHDATVDRTTNGTGRVADMTLAEIRRLRCSNGEPVPTLAGAVAAVGGRADVNVELKNAACAAAVAEYFRKKDRRRVLFSAFDWSALEILARQLPHARLGVLVGRYNRLKRPFHTAKRLKAWSVNPSVQLLTRAFVRRAHASGFRIFAYGAASRARVLHCLRQGADGLFADHPDQAGQVLSEWIRAGAGTACR